MCNTCLLLCVFYTWKINVSLSLGFLPAHFMRYKEFRVETAKYYIFWVIHIHVYYVLILYVLPVHVFKCELWLNGVAKRETNGITWMATHIFIDLANFEIFGCYSLGLCIFKQLHPPPFLLLCKIFAKQILKNNQNLDQWIAFNLILTIIFLNIWHSFMLNCWIHQVHIWINSLFPQVLYLNVVINT